MIEEIISLLVASKKIPEDVAAIKRCLYSSSGIFLDEDSEFDFKMSYLANDLESIVNLVLEPRGPFKSIFYLDENLGHCWSLLTGMHYFQLGQLIRYREASIFRFVITFLTGAAVTGTIYIFGGQYAELSEKYEAEMSELDSWIGSISHDRFSGKSKGVSSNIPPLVISEEMLRALPDHYFE